MLFRSALDRAGFILDFGYSRFQDTGSATHAWVSWRDDLDRDMMLVVDFLLNIVGYQGAHNSDGLMSGQWVQSGSRWVPKVARPPSRPSSPLATQPLVGGDMADMVAQGASVAQPLAGGAQRTSSSSGLTLPRPIAQVAQPFAGSCSGLPQPMAQPLAGKVVESSIESSIAPCHGFEDPRCPSTASHPWPAAGPPWAESPGQQLVPEAQPLVGSGRLDGVFIIINVGVSLELSCGR